MSRSPLSAHSGEIVASVDAEDIDELQRPFRSARFVVDNDSGTAVSSLQFESAKEDTAVAESLSTTNRADLNGRWSSSMSSASTEATISPL